MNGLLLNLRNLGPARLAAIGAVLAATVGFFVFISTRLATPTYGLLYSDLDARDSGQIVQRLEALNVPYQLSADGTQILVPVDQVARLRIAIAESGLPHGGSVGYEIFDKSEQLGTSSFVQNLNHLRALEGELARTISSIDAVQAARVHLVLPQREVFSREKQEPSAAIVIKSRGGERLGKMQVAAIQHLVAAAVPGLRPGRISIADTEGNLLARGNDDGVEPSAGGANSEEMRVNYETRLSRSVEEMLERSVGPGKARVEVHAEMDFDRITTNSESFDPDGQVVRSTQSVNETSTSSEGGDQPVTVANNLPEAQANKGAAGAQSKTGRNEETINYEITKTVKNQTREGGIVKRLSVAVLVDGTYAAGTDGTKAYQPRSPEELKQIETLVRTAIGFDEKRGDTVRIVNLRFITPEEPVAAAAEGFLGFSRGELLRAAEPLALGIIGLLVILLVVKPLVSRMLEMPPGTGIPALSAPDAQRLLTGPTVAGALPPPGGAALGVPATAVPTSRPLDHIEQMIDISQVEGRVRASSIKKIGEIVEKHPEEAVAIVRSWMYQNA
ncbi:MAG: flagellar M-ring protein FliF, partial [Alphaproteobacteria bacterium]|nr:flagellar M-ring protein FliF [Alphaproteobacteria bacterium]